MQPDRSVGTAVDRAAAPTRLGGRRSVAWADVRLPMYVSAVGLALIGFNQIDIGTLPISDFVFFALGGVLWLLMLSGRGSRVAPAEFRRSSPRILAASILLLVFGTISGFRSWDPPGSIGQVLRIAYLTMFWFWMLRCLSINRRAIATFLTAWKVGVIISAVAAILANAGLFELGIQNPENRQTGWFAHPNDLGGFIAVAVPIFVMGAPQALTQRRRSGGTWRLVLLGTVVFAMSTTGSMSAFLAAILGTAVAGLGVMATGVRDGRRRTLHPLKAMGLVLVAGIAIVLLFNSDAAVVERFTRYEQGDAYVTGSVGGRGAANEVVINNFDDALVIGHGLDSLGQVNLDLDVGVHNMYLKMLYEGGLVAATALVLIAIVTLQQAWRLLVNTRSTAIHRDIAAVTGSVVAAIVFANFQPTSTQRYYWLPIAMIQCYWTLRRSEIASGASEDELDDWSDRSPSRRVGELTAPRRSARAAAEGRPALAARPHGEPGGTPTGRG